MILSDLEWLSRIYNDTKRRAVSLRQLSFLFYRAMRMHNADCVRPYVCLSVTSVTTKHILKLFSPPGSHTILVFPYQTLGLWQYSNRDPSLTGRRRRMQVKYEKIKSWFSTNISPVSGMVQNRDIVTIDTNIKLPACELTFRISKFCL